MLRPARMEKVRIFAAAGAVPVVIKTLHELGIVEIRRFKTKGLEEGRPLSVFDEISESLVKIRATVSALGLGGAGEHVSAPAEKLFAEAKAVDETVGARVRGLLSEKTALDEDIRQISAKLAIASKLTLFKDVDFSRLRTKSLDYAAGELPTAKIINFKNRLDGTLKYYNLIVPEQKAGSSLALLIYPKGSRQLDIAFAEAGFSPLQVPGETTLPVETEHRMKTEISDGKKKIAAIEKEMHEIATKNGKKLLGLLEAFSVESDRAEITSRFAASKRVVGIQGWVKAADFGRLEKAMAAFGDSVILQKAEIDEHEQPPIVFDNPGYAAPFEFLTKDYSLPNYFEIDPSMIYLITMPLLYGMIVGDVFYGIISFLIAKWLAGKYPKSEIMVNVTKIWTYSAVAAIFFGLIYDEWGGMPHFAHEAGKPSVIGLLEQWTAGAITLHQPVYMGFNRIESATMLIAITALVGLIHIALGFAIGAYNQWHHSKKHAFAKICWIGVEIGGLLALLAFFFSMASATVGYVGGGLLLVSIAGIAFTEGIIGIIEIPGLLGNILSYTRIAAIGIVGVVIAELINEFLMPLPAQGVFAIILVPIFVGLHFVNAFIAMFEALIQGGRLNIIEFKSKFLEGGGVLFAPFSLRSKNR